MATPIILPRQGQSVESCIITEILVKIGDQVNIGDVLFRYETDKAAFELESEAEGYVIDLFFAEGDEVPVLDEVMLLGEQAEKKEERGKRKKEKRAQAPNQPSPQPTNPPSPQPTNPPTHQATNPPSPQPTKPPSHQATKPPSHQATSPVSPRAKRLAERLGISYGHLTGTGPGGRIIERDIEALAQTGGRLSPLAQAKAKESGMSAPGLGSGVGGRILDSDLGSTQALSGNEYTDKKLSNIRRIIAQNMQASLQNSAQLTHHMSADARAILAIRQEVKKKMETETIENITLNDLVCFALIKALKKMPEINTHFLGDQLRTFEAVHLGIAVDTERGLMVPALRHADRMDIQTLSASIKALANSCKNGNVDPDLLAPTAASFTVSNLGAFGVEMFTPVINLPQAGILGVNTIIQRPGDVGGGIIGFIPYLGLSLTYDHRVLDGAPASAFLREIKEQVENLAISI